MEGNNLVEWPPAGVLTIVYNIFTNRFGPPDVHFRAGPWVFKVHKKVLENQSSVLKAKLSDVWQTSGDVLQLDEQYVEPEVVEELLEWMYHTEAFPHISCPCEVEIAQSLCVAADYLIIPKLVASCCGVLGSAIDEKNFYKLFTFSKHRCLNDLGKACELAFTKTPKTFFLSSQVVEWKVEDLKMLIEKLLEVANSPNNRETILSSLAIWIDTDEDRSQELDELLEIVAPEELPSDALFRFTQTEFYLKFDEPHRKQCFVYPYLAKQFNLDSQEKHLLQEWEGSLELKRSDYFLRPQVVKLTVEIMSKFIEKWLEVEDSPKVRETILSSLIIWAQGSVEDRLPEMDNLLKFVPPEKLSSGDLFRFMESELYSKLDESHRKQYHVHPYLPTGITSTDKLYCVTKKDPERYLIANCLDLSTGGQWSDLLRDPQRFAKAYSQYGWDNVSVLSLGKNIHFSHYIGPEDPRNSYYYFSEISIMNIKTFSTETDKWIDTEEEGEDYELDLRLHNIMQKEEDLYSESL